MIMPERVTAKQLSTSCNPPYANGVFSIAGMTEKPVPGNRQTILIIDSVADRSRSLRDLLAPLGHAVLEAGSTGEALKMIASRTIDLVLCDLAIPDTGGSGLCCILRSHPRTQSIAVFLIADAVDAHKEAIGISAGADDFLVRPMQANRLYARVQSLLRKKTFFDSADDVESVLISLAQAVEARDPGTGKHCQRLALLSSTLGVAAGLGPHELVTLQRGAFLHDIGKIAVPDNILFKRGPLTAEEWVIMKEHTTCGERICSGMKSLASVLPIIRSHHERWNGSGSPDGLCGENIPLLARILQVADIYDALVSERPYKTALTPDDALRQLQTEAKAGWRDPRLVEAFTDLYPLFNREQKNVSKLPNAREEKADITRLPAALDA
jgi:cyclic di-GMP phosphodiesterase